MYPTASKSSLFSLLYHSSYNSYYFIVFKCLYNFTFLLFYTTNIPMSLCKLQTTLFLVLYLVITSFLSLNSSLCLYIYISSHSYIKIKCPKECVITLHFLLLFTFLKGFRGESYIAFAFSFRNIYIYIHTHVSMYVCYQ